MQLNKIWLRGTGGVALALCCLSGAYATGGNDWPLYSHDYANSNFNPDESKISPHTAPTLRRAWETFNDAKWRLAPPPSGFVLEAALGLKFPASVVGVIAPPVIRDGTIYYIDALGTMFARDAKTGTITDRNRHWTTTLVDPDFAAPGQPLAPELYYSAPVVSDGLIWVHSSFNGRVHALKLVGGAELDFDPSKPGIQPLALTPDQKLASNLGEPVIVRTQLDPTKLDSALLANSSTAGTRKLFITEVNVILNDALIQGGQGGFVVALDITDPGHPFEAWRTPMIDINAATGKRYSAGVSAGSGFAVDLGRHLIYGGTGQNTMTPYPGYPDASMAPAGYVDRSDSVYALDYRNGKIVWFNQLHKGDVFDLNNPVPAGPGRTDGPRDADVLSPPVLFTARTADGSVRDLVGAGSKGGLYRVVDRVTGATVWERQISKATGLGGIQGGAAYAKGVLYVAGFEGIDDGFSDANFDAPGSKYKNAFFSTFSPAFWADVEDVREDGMAITGMQTLVHALDAGTGKPVWKFNNGKDHLELKAGAALRHVSVANGLLYVTTSAGLLQVFNTTDGTLLFKDQTPDLNVVFNLGLNKPHHAGMNAGALISDGMVYVPYGAQNNPSGGMLAYRLGK
ncbi:outer membrane protein assembly factor BamB [Oxalobacteraceae bacterium GrIS 1.11]